MADVVNILCIRDPDSSNEYVSDGEVNEITIDIGGQWSDFSDFGYCLRNGELDALEYERVIMEEVSHLAEDNPVRVAAADFFQAARDA